LYIEINFDSILRASYKRVTICLFIQYRYYYCKPTSLTTIPIWTDTKPFDGVKELITSTLSECSKAVVTGLAKEEVDTIIDEIFGMDAFWS
jgi:hypothetical protein